MCSIMLKINFFLQNEEISMTTFYRTMNKTERNNNSTMNKIEHT